QSLAPSSPGTASPTTSHTSLTTLFRSRRASDLTKMSELQYGIIPQLEKQLDLASHAEMMDMKLLRNNVTEEEVAEVVSRWTGIRSEEHTSELQSREKLVCRLLLAKKKV